MHRRQVVAALAACALGACSEPAGPGDLPIASVMPGKIRLVPGDLHIRHVGRLADGRLFWVTSQLDQAPEGTKDYVCTFVFNDDGEVLGHNIELIGVRGAYPTESVGIAVQKHVTALGAHTVEAIWVRTFSVDVNGVEFGLIPRLLDDGEWRVEFMPGNTLSFYAPWEEGEYDT